MSRLFLALFFLVLTSLFLISNPVKIYAEEAYKGSMEWLALESKEMPVGGAEGDTPDIIIAPPAELTVPELSEISFHYPLPHAAVVTTRFSSSHPGIDFAISEGTTIFAAESGLVTISGWDTTGYGQTVVLHHARTTYTRYAHLSSITVSVGQYIYKGMPIGYVGCTGRCTGPHLHLEIRNGDHFIDPLVTLNF